MRVDLNQRGGRKVRRVVTESVVITETDLMCKTRRGIKVQDG